MAKAGGQSHSVTSLDDRDVFKPRIVGCFSPSLPNTVYPTLTTTSLLTLRSPFSRTRSTNFPMAYFDNTDNTNFYSAPFSSGEFMGYPFLNQVSVTEETNVQTLGTFADDWSVGGGQGCIASSSRGLGAGPSLGKCSRSLLGNSRLTHGSPESVTSVNPYEAQSHSHGEPSFPEYYWPVTGQYTQSRRSEVLSRDNSFANIVASEAPTEISAPSSGEYLFFYETLKNRVLTDRKQHRSITGEITRADYPPARSAR